MKLVGVRDAQEHLSGLLRESQKERILLTRHGRPMAVLSGVEGRDLEDILLEQDSRFAALIASRRRGGSRLVPLEEVIARTEREERLEERPGRYRAKPRGALTPREGLVASAGRGR